MTISSAQTRIPSELQAEAVALLRSLLLCQVAEHADRARECRATGDALIGQADIESVLERELAETSALHFDGVVHEAREALRPMDDGTYGFCEACAAPIPFERLEAIPHARRCVGCRDEPARPIG